MVPILPFTLQQNIATDNAFSTIQLIHQIKAKMDEVIKVVNSIETDAHEYTDAKILELKADLEGQLDQLNTILSGQITTLTGRVNNLNDLTTSTIQLVNEISSTLTALQVTVSQNYSTLNSKIDENRLEMLERLSDLSTDIINYLDAQIALLYEEVNRLINERTAYAYNGWTGKWEKIDKCIFDVCKYLVGTVTRPITVKMSKKHLSTRMNTASGVSTLLSDFTIGDLKSVVVSGGTGFTVSVQKTTSGTSSALPLIENTLENAKLNQLARIYGIGYRLFRSVDVGNYVVPYTYYMAVTSYTGIDSFQLQETYAYVYN